MKGTQKCEVRHGRHKVQLELVSVRQTQLQPPTEIHSPATPSVPPCPTEIHPVCLRARCYHTHPAHENRDFQPHRRPVDFKLRFHGCRVQAHFPCWAERVERPRQKRGGGVGVTSKKPREQRKLWGRRGKRGQHQLQELLPRVRARCCQTPAERMESRAPSLPKARARRGISKFSWLPWRDSPLTNGEQMRPFSR